ncbi:uncharacterized protein BHQ10_002746 [Talaromyces amestolkiae]|uniref:Uncharacterized protein n=1 Tax=Talaromyces amestolkiae TaxID=1196081 RepID=A0A364KT53_TALAM|nr:uncharacterized protein BHQ10_002746 [Talaromyces amestolkiae]RAO66734.1 hypothetical protein BHQ10_002746 [Talaromyces amestolkiae]
MNQITISSDSDSDASVFATSTTTNRHPHPQSSHHHHHHYTQHPTLPINTANNNNNNPTSDKPDKRKTTTHHTHETMHLSHTILSSKELLLLHSLAANESVPRTRRRLWAQVIEADDPVKAEKLLYDGAPSLGPSGLSGAGGGGGGGGEGGTTVVGGLRVAAGNVVDVVEMGDGDGWERLRVKKSASRSPIVNKTSSSPGGSSKKGLQSRRVVSGERSGSPLASPVVRRGGRRIEDDGDVDMDIS